jgi:outer membrane protein assembly factor BamB
VRNDYAHAGRRILLLLVAALACAPAASGAGAESETADAVWPRWRGPLATGVAPRGDPPVEWSETSNVRWKTALPGRGHSTPIVWGDRIFLTTAVPTGEAMEPGGEHAPGAHDNVEPTHRLDFIVLAVNLDDGAIVWQRKVHGARPHEGTHVTGTWASSSAVTDGERLFAFFGSNGLYALDLDGKPLWDVDLGDMRVRHAHGEGASPALHGDTLVVNWDHQGDSFLVALDARNGKERWKVARDEITSWSSPLIVEHGDKTQVVVSATRRVRGYDLASGEVIWESGGLSRNVVATPVAADGLVFAANSYDWKAMLAIRLDRAKGDVTGTDAVVWSRDRDTPYVPSPLLYGDALCFLKHNQGFLTCVNAKTGNTVFGPERLSGIRNVFASPVGASRRIYIVDRDGNTAVVGLGAEFKLLALNGLDDSFAASPAIAGDTLILRGERYLYGIAAD